MHLGEAIRTRQEVIICPRPVRVLKDRLARLGSAVRRALGESKQSRPSLIQREALRAPTGHAALA